MNENTKTIQTLILSQVPQKERIDIYKFLIENQIRFKRESNGEYTAILHVLNPVYYTNDLKEKPQHAHNSFNNRSKKISPSNTTNNLKKMKKTSSEPLLLVNNSNSNHHFPFSKYFHKQQNVNYSNQRIQQYNESFNHLYPKFYFEVKPMIGIRGKKINVFQLRLLIEEVYSIRFIHDSTFLKNQLCSQGKAIVIGNPFPIFVYQFLSNKYAKKATIDQQALNLLLSVEHYKTINNEIEMFSKMLSEEYDSDDLVFFLFVRSCIESETKIMFLEKAQHEVSLQHMEDRDLIDTEIYLNTQLCFNIANTLFGNDEPLLIKAFMNKVERNISKDNNGIKSSTLLSLTIDDYHLSKIKQKDNEGLKALRSPQTHPSNIENKDNCKKSSNTDDSDFFSDDYPENDQLNLKNDKNTDINQLNSVQSPQENNKNNPEAKDEQEEQLFSYSNDYQNEQIEYNYEDFYKSLIAFYQNEENSNSSEHKAIIKELLYTYIQEKEINIFFSKLFTYDSNDHIVEIKLSQIKELILKKISVLINILSNSDKNAWFASLQIESNNKCSIDHFDSLKNLFILISSFSPITSIPESKIEKFCSELLMTQELMAQITKVIETNF